MRTTPAASKAPHAQAELALLYCAAHSQIDDIRSEQMRRLLSDAPIDWPWLLQIAQWHGLSPLLFTKLNSTFRDLVPPRTLLMLRERFYANAARQVRLSNELIRLLEVFDAHDIRALPLKGPVLAESAYGNLSLRECGDLDILLRKQDIAKATDLLLRAPGRDQYRLAPTDGRRHWANHHTVVRTDGRSTVELHWAMLPPRYCYERDLDDVWPRRLTVSFRGSAIFTLPSDESLLFLCAHGAKHQWCRLRWVCDVAGLIGAGPGIDWDLLLERARVLTSQCMVSVGIRLARDLLDASVPDQALRRMASDAKVADLANQAYQSVLKTYESAPDNLVEDPGFYLRCRERLLDRIRYCQRTGEIPRGTDGALLPRPARCLILVGRIFIWNEQDARVLHLPASMTWLYYLVRPLRLLVTYGMNPRSWKRTMANAVKARE